MDQSREYTSKRSAITKALAGVLNQINGEYPYLSDLGNNTLSRLVFWDEIEEFPAVSISAGSERREYQGGGYKDRYLSVTVRLYVKEEDSLQALEKLLEDLETVIENNSRLAYLDSQGVTQFTRDITIVSIDTDEGVLAPLGVGEILLQVTY